MYGREIDNKVEKFLPNKITKGGVLEILSMPRNTDGSLTNEALAMMTANEQSEKETQISQSQEGKITADPSVSKEDLIRIMSENVNPLTTETMYPELRNLTDPNKETDANVTETMLVAGVAMKITYNKSDVNFAQRLSMLEAAVKKIQAKGFTVPPLDVNLPKAGRQITVSGECKVSVTGSSHRAVYVVPKFMHISSENKGNPLTDKDSDDHDKYKFSSTTLDPGGIGTIIHEFGHFLHFVNAPEKFHGLWGTAFSGRDPHTKELYRDRTFALGQK